MNNQNLLKELITKLDDTLNIDLIIDKLYIYDIDHEDIIKLIKHIDEKTLLFKNKILSITTGYYEILEDENLYDSPYTTINDLSNLNKEQTKDFTKSFLKVLKEKNYH